MTALGERTLISWVTDREALALITEEGFDPEILPTPGLRPVLAFAQEYLFRSGLERAPSESVLRSYFGPVLDDAEIDLSFEPDEDVGWAMDDLRSSWVHRQSSDFNKRFATAMAEAPVTERITVLNEYASEMVHIGMSVESRSRRVDMRSSTDDIMRAYEGRVATRGQFRGMGFGLDEIDRQTYGIQDGELAVVAAPPKVGKSMWQCWVAYREWLRGRRVVMFTLENSVDMMLNRIACIASGTDAGSWERGEAVDEEVQRMQEALDRIKSSEVPLLVMQPDIGQRSIPQMVREAQIKGADSLLIDQLTFVEVGDGPGDRRPKHEKIGHALHDLKAMISTSRKRIPCLLTHQVNREGVKAADKVGYLEPYHMAEAAEVERTADFIFGLYASRDQRELRQVTFQMLGARRTATKNWTLAWRPEAGIVRVRQEVDLGG